MASHSSQYIFGEFSPDEFNQFFVTPRCYVELPPFNDKVPRVSQSSGRYCTPAVPFLTETMKLQVCGEDYQRIEFGVDEVIEPEPVGVKDSMYKVSSTLNPQAPEFILGCQPSQKVLDSLQASGSREFDSVDCQDSELPALDGSGACQDMDGAPGSLGPRERKKKKKRPPGYYNYLEGSSSSSSSNGGNSNSGGGAQAHSDAQLVVGLVNGHAVGTASLGSEEIGGEPAAAAAVSGAELPRGSPASGGAPAVAATGSIATVSVTNNQRTCESPDESSSDFTSGAASLSDSNNAVSSSSSSHSSGVAEGGRTAEQPPEPSSLENPELLASRRDSPSPTSLLLSSARASCIVATTAAACLNAASASATTDAAHAAAAATTDEEEGGHSGAPNGLPAPESQDSGEAPEDSAEPRQHQAGAPAEAKPAGERAQSPPLLAAPAAAPPSGAANPPKSWASLFHNSKPSPGGPAAYVEVKSAPAAVVATQATAQAAEKPGEVMEGPVHVSEDPMAPKIAEMIENVKLIHKPVSLQPRGLINKGNWCYINATLQALIACPPMYHLMKSIPMFSETQRPCSSTPMIDNFVHLVNEFSNMPVPSKAKQQAAGDKIMKDIRPGAPFEPTYIYRLLTVIKSSLSEKGRQEDAEEYLGFILNGLHEEMLALKKLIAPQEEKVSTINGPEPQLGAEEENTEKEENGSEDEWEQVGPRNKSSVTRHADFIRTPITDIFGGHIRSVVYQQSSKESATLQPFFSLQLDIQSEKIRTVQEALETLVARESVQGYTTKTKQEIEISRRVTLEELPPVLVLHLKRFVYEKTGGCQKLVKNIEYPVDLEISKDLLSPGVRGKIFKGQRTYRLFAVVYHHGNSATGGHYTTDVFHIGLNGWLRIDDQAVKVINQFFVTKPTAERTAYLLYYRRVDLL
ncbi:ubiquitin carboxyl-terminal hydrolase 10 isoform X2 [Lepisosteus oculatus]|uniref:ubiquitin carboxyl-terminal hydrolase 10 isoform X2 n=1 Tax=Lepisosteus oculatus TaxID=7918 RepID=UPI00073FCEF4|nr:PREDICTED: ubiquitin carboxyl-terminal hydrolase 10 isoform X2 [Lepisosteus oculatus]